MFVAKRQIKESEGRRYLENPKRYPGFLEHYYSHPETKPWEPHTEEIKRQIAGLFENPVFLRLSRVANKICEIEELQQIQVETVPVWVSLDVLVEDGQDGYVIIDWKTGREHQADKVAAQLGVYGVYVHHQYFRHHQADGRPVGGLKAMYVNTRHNTHETFVVDAEMIADAGRLIHQSAKSMLELLADKTENIANKEDFPVIEEGSAACSQCSYRRACGRE
jgi:hypothetical protein